MPDSENRSALPVSALLFAAVATGGYFLVTTPLESLRHKEKLPYDTVGVTSETVPARSWQDPIKAIHADWHGLVDYIFDKDNAGNLPPGVSPPKTVTGFGKEIQRRFSRDPGVGNGESITRAPLVIGVLTPGGPFAEDAEVRRRQRHALVTALAEQAGLPTHPEHIGYFIAPRNSPESGAKLTSVCATCRLVPAPILVAYEEFDFDKSGTLGRVLVLWMSNTDFQGDVIATYSEMLEILLGPVEIWQQNGASMPRVALVGPDNSTDLLKLLRHAGHGASASLKSYPDNVFEIEDIRNLQTRNSDGPPEQMRETFSNFALSQPQQFMQPVTRMVATIDEYLDSGLPADAATLPYNSDQCTAQPTADTEEPPLDARTALEACFEQLRVADMGADDELRGALSNCLHQEPVCRITDSDPDWRNTVLADLMRTVQFQRAATGYYDQSGAADKNADKLFAALTLTNDYLDLGLRAPESHVDDFNACFFASEDEACADLGSQFSDSDPEWTTTVRAAFHAVVALSDKPADVIQTAHESGWRSSILLISPRATIPPKYFPDSGIVSSDVTTDKAVAEKLKVGNFRSAVARDDEVLRIVLRELEARGINSCKRSSDSIAVLVELDSEYGRKLVLILKDLVAEIWGADAPGCAPAIEAYAYLRGVDGETPPPKTHTIMTGTDLDRGREARNQQRPATSTVHVESAVGPTQLDYVRRLADQIAGGRSAPGGRSHGRFRAVGVLGADVYDKQLILHALKERLPGVILFTTDLDSRLVSSESHKWNRNLLVGSSYGLSLARGGAAESTSDTRQVAIQPPPFRDSYQTAFYSAIRQIVEPASQQYAPTPRLFEIGRTDAIDITRDTARPEQAALSLASVVSAMLGTATPGLSGWPRYAGSVPDRIVRNLIVLLPLLVLALSNYSWLQRRNSSQERYARQAHRRAARVSGAAFLILFVVMMFWNKASYEPWLLFEGLSAIPTMVLQLTALVYAICLMVIAQGRISEADARISREFFDRPPRRVRVRGLRGIAAIASSLRMSQLHRRISAGKPASALRLWSRYQAFSAWQGRLFRAFLIAAFTLFAIFMLLRYEGPASLARDLGVWPDVFRYSSAFFSLLLLFFCTDALKTAQALLLAIGSDSSAELAGDSAPADRHGSLPTWTFGPDFGQGCEAIQEQSRRFELILEYTKWITPLTVFPTVVLAILLISRAAIFDGWTWSAAIMAVYAGAMLYLLIRAYLYQKAAEAARDGIILKMKVCRANLLIDGRDNEAAVTQAAIEEIGAPRSGAFVPWTRHPILQSIALPSGGVGLLALIESVF